MQLVPASLQPMAMSTGLPRPMEACSMHDGPAVAIAVIVCMGTSTSSACCELMIACTQCALCMACHFPNNIVWPVNYSSTRPMISTGWSDDIMRCCQHRAAGLLMAFSAAAASIGFRIPEAERASNWINRAVNDY